jgi:hypothetical protein
MDTANKVKKNVFFVNPTPTALPMLSIVWQYDVSNVEGEPQWENFDAKATSQIEAAFQQEDKPSITLKLGFPGKIGFHSYTINVRQMTQTNDATEKERPIRRKIYL